MVPGPARHRFSIEEIIRRLTAMRDVIGTLATADAAEKATMYAQVGLSMTLLLCRQACGCRGKATVRYVRKAVSEGGLELPVPGDHRGSPGTLKRSGDLAFRPGSLFPAIHLGAPGYLRASVTASVTRGGLHRDRPWPLTSCRGLSTPMVMRKSAKTCP